MYSILAIDDCSMLRSAIAISFKKFGNDYTITEATSGAHGINKINQHRNSGKDPYDLILVDVNMTPELNGYETVKAIREIPEYEKTPILFLTANSAEEAIQQGKDADANGWIVKPFTPEVLVQTVKKVLS